jgi:phospholipid/cholesterol/gamma-HCH transport system substrate-binding protein
MMETRAHHVLIGIFTVLIVSAGLLFAVWLARSSAERQFHEFDIIFNEAVTGLGKGGSVEYNGIKVGSIYRIQLDPSDPRRVIARIRVGADVPVRKDTHAKLALTGITGVAVIQLSGGAPPSPDLETDDGSVPRIIADPSPLSQLLANGQDLVTNINQAVLRASALLSPENTARIGRTLDHIDKITSTVSEDRSDIHAMLSQLALASKEANDTLKATKTLVDHANVLVTGPGAQTLASARETMASLERASASLDHILVANRDAIDSGAQGLNELGPTIHELHETINSLHKIARQINENPTRYILGREQTKEFKP